MLDVKKSWVEREDAARSKRDAEILAAHATGRSLQNIADSFGLTRQRVHQIVRGAVRS